MTDTVAIPHKATPTDNAPSNDITVENERNIKLALAIGWPFSQIHVNVDGVMLGNKPKQRKRFDYKDPAVIWELAKLYDAFPSESLSSETNEKWLASSGKVMTVQAFRAATPEFATYLAVIDAAKHYKPWQLKGKK